MKQKRFPLISLFLLSGLIMLFSSCEKEKNNSGSLGKAIFIIGSKGEDELDKGLYKYTPGSEPQFISNLYPYNYSSWYADKNNGLVAFSVASNLRENTSGIAYMYVNNLEDIKFVPIPGAEEGFHYSVSFSNPPRVLSDGRIAYSVELHTDNEYDTWFAGMIAIYNPKNGEIELSGDPTEFVLSQPEKWDDTEDGTMKKGFVISTDDRYAFCEAYGYGTEGGEVHRDFTFMTRYSIGIPGSYDRLAQMNAYPAGVTGDGRYLLLTDGSFGLKKLDLSTNILSQVADYYMFPASGQISGFSSKIIRTWIAAGSYGAGFGELDLSTSPAGWIQIIDEKLISSPTNYYSDIALGVQYSTDESEIYFGVYRSSVQNSYIDICSTPKIELNEEPTILGQVSSAFDMNVLILVND